MTPTEQSTFDTKLEEIRRKIELLNDRCPIEYPDQLYLRNGDEYIDSYDPVYSISIDDGNVLIEGDCHTLYEHSLEDFDSIYITQDEPVDLNNPLYTRDKIRGNRLAEEL